MKYIAPVPVVVAATTALVEYIALATAVVAYDAPAPVRIAAPVPVVWASHQLLKGHSFYASGGAHRANYRSDRSTYAGYGEHRAAVSVVPEPSANTSGEILSLCLPCSWRRHSQCVQRQDQWQSTFRIFCQYRGARTSSVRSASASGRVHS